MIEYNYLEFVSDRKVPNTDGWYWDVEFNDPNELPPWINVYYRNHQCVLNTEVPDKMICLDSQGKYFFTVDAGYPLMATEGDNYWSTCIGLVKNIYCLPKYRRCGVQAALLKRLTTLASGCRQPVYIASSPFELCQQLDDEDTIFDALQVMASSSQVIYNRDEEEHKKQRRRFLAAGFVQSKFDLCDEKVDTHCLILPNNLDMLEDSILQILELKNIVKPSPAVV